MIRRLSDALTKLSAREESRMNMTDKRKNMEERNIHCQDDDG